MTETVLVGSRDAEGHDPYTWVRQDLPAGRVLDVGCGSAPTWSVAGGWVGLDRSASELDLARQRGRGPLVRAEAGSVPIRDSSVGTALAVMSLMVVDDPESVLAELARVLRPGGTLRLLVPADGLLTARDRVRYTLLLAALGRRVRQGRLRLPFPQPDLSRRLEELVVSAGFSDVRAESRRFELGIRDGLDAQCFTAGLYLPGARAHRVRLAAAVVRSWGPVALGVPLRRLTARRSP